MFIHGGHTSRVTDIGWSPNNPWHLASAAEDNVLQVRTDFPAALHFDRLVTTQLWSPSQTIWAADDVPVEAIDLEAEE